MRPKTTKKFEVDYLFLFGKFNPVTKGHLFAMWEALSQINTKHGLIVNITYTDVWNRKLADYSHRRAMLQAAIAETPELASRVTISDLEKDLELSGYTVETLERYADILFPGARFGMLVGEDVLVDLPSWKDIQRLLRLTKIFVLPRGGATGTEDLRQVVPDILKSQLDHQVILLKLKERREHSTFSSTAVRSDLRNRSRMVPEIVLKYINDHGLYLTCFLD